MDGQPDRVDAVGGVAEIGDRHALRGEGQRLVVETGHDRLGALLGDRHHLAGALDAQDLHLVAVDAVALQDCRQQRQPGLARRARDCLALDILQRLDADIVAHGDRVR